MTTIWSRLQCVTIMSKRINSSRYYITFHSRIALAHLFKVHIKKICLIERHHFCRNLSDLIWPYIISYDYDWCIVIASELSSCTKVFAFEFWGWVQQAKTPPITLHTIYCDVKTVWVPSGMSAFAISSSFITVKQNGQHFTGDILYAFLVTEKVNVLIQFSLKFIPPQGQIDNSSLVQAMVWNRTGVKLLYLSQV